MPYAVTLRLDPADARHVRALWDSLSDAGFSDSAVTLGYVPHLTLAIVDGSVDAAGLIDLVRRTTTGWHALRLQFAALAVFPGEPATLWLAPAVTAYLLECHAELCAALPGVHPHYRRGAWMPHVTLADDLVASATGAALASAAEQFQAFSATFSCVDLLRFRPIELLWQAMLAAGT